MNTKEKEKYVPALSFDFLTPFYDTAAKWTTREKIFKKKLVRQIEIAAGGRLLDLACGTATLTVALKKNFQRRKFTGLTATQKSCALPAAKPRKTARK